MPYITEIDKDGEFAAAATSFSASCASNAPLLGLSPANLTEIANAATGFNTNLDAWFTARNAAAFAVQAKDTQKVASKAVIAKWAKVFRANIAVPDSLLSQLMLPPHNTPGQETAPNTPLNFVGSANGDGFVTLQWSRTGNIQGTVFIVEYRLSASDPWTILETTTKRTMYAQANPGEYIAFRVKAQRHGISSPASTPFVLWDTEQSAELQIAA